MSMSFWVRIDLDPALAESASPDNIKQVCEEIEGNVAGVQKVRSVEQSIGQVFDSYIGEYKC
jgi:hypothetical protein